jgi:hypothetical protein
MGANDEHGEECDFCERQGILRPNKINDIVWHICKGCEIEAFFIREVEDE